MHAHAMGLGFFLAFNSNSATLCLANHEMRLSELAIIIKFVFPLVWLLILFGCLVCFASSVSRLLICC